LTVISKYLAKNIVTRILVVMFITSSIFLLFEYLNQSSNIGRSNFTLYTALEFSILKIPNIINKIIEISILIGGLYAFAGLINNRELTIINSSGFSNFSVIKKTTLITLIFSFLSILLIDIVAPIYSKKADVLKTEALGQIFDYGQDGEFWMKKNKSFLKFVNHSKKNTYKDVLFFSLNERGQVKEIIYSDTASINQNNIIKFNKGEIFIFNGRKLLIQRCLNNLIENSTKFANKIEVSFQKLKSNILIIIEDNGPGIPINERENVFKPFYKIDKSRSEKSSSVGLGLSISSDIIRSHGGKIELSESNLGGLKIVISLPF